MPRRSFRVSYKINYRVRYRREVRLTQTYRPIAIPTPIAASPTPRMLTTRRTVTTSPLYPLRKAVTEYTPEADDGRPDEQKQFDVFVCHAGEDKEAVVRPLAQALRDIALDVWFDEFELHIGDSLRRSIDRGLANSRFGVVVLSPAFFAKNWPNYELNGLVTREMAAGGQQIILPIWHNVSNTDVIRYSPSLADKLARSTADTDMAQIAREIAEVIRR